MFTRRSRLFSSIALAALLALTGLFAATLQAQNITTAQLNGTVRDKTGAVVPNVTVTIADASRGFSRTTTSDAQGNYQLLELPPGTYTVTASYTGFNTFVNKNVVLNIGDQAQLPLSLSVGSTQTVTVSSGADLIEAQRSSQSTTIDQERIDNLPTNGRNYINFTLTNSQIARDAAPAVGAIPTSGLNFGGVRARSNSINVDGADAGDYISGGTRSTVSQDAVTHDKPTDRNDNSKSRAALSGTPEPQGQELVYAARISLNRTEMQVEDKTVSLAPGMAVTVEIKTGQRRVIEYLLSPLLRYRHEAIRER